MNILFRGGEGMTFLASLLALAMTQTGSAQGNLAVPPHRWTIDYGQMSCTLARRLGAENSPIFAFNAPLGWEPGELLILDGGTGLDRRLTGELEVRIDGGAPLVVRSRREQRGGRPLVKLAPMPEDFLDRVATATQLVVGGNGGDILSLALPGSREAIDALTRCNDDLLQSWGIDVEARRALQRKPRVRGIDWASEIMPSASTFLVFAVDVSEQGRPLTCRIAISSRNERMDRAFCNLVQSRARFEPALDAQGRSVPAQYVTRVRWEIEEGN